MCGITGWIDWHRDLSQERATLVKMTQTLAARGPDAEGYYVAPRAALGHRRLIVVDPQGGEQPMLRRCDEHNCILVYNGELYNTEELRQELRQLGYTFAGHSDTEVLLVSYLAWGPPCVDKFNGIFAFAIWDERQNTLFMARDRLGVKPLFYAELPGAFIFGSEPKALLAHPQVAPMIDSTGLAEVLLMGPARTPGLGIFKGVRELRPGHILNYSQRGLTIRPYWQLTARAHRDDAETTIATVRDLFIDTVKRQLVSDVPIGTLLSGGLDSSAITAVAAREQALKDQSLPTFSIDYLDNEKHFHTNAFQPDADAPWVKRVSDHLGTAHHAFALDTPELADALLEACQARDFPGMADIDSSLLLFSRRIKEHVTVALSGECADEVFGGYPWFHRPECLEANTFPWALRWETRLQVLAPDILALLRPQEYVSWRYSEALAEVPSPADESHPYNPASQEQKLREIAYLTLTRFMPVLLDRKDRMTMACGLEVRVPYCDHRLVEYVWNIPWQLKTWGNREKGLLRHALTGILPDDVLWRRKSPYPKTHNPAYLHLLSTRLRTILAEPNSPVIPLLNLPALHQLLDAAEKMPNGQPWFGQLMDIPQLFAYLIQLNYWLQTYHVSLP